MLQVKKLAKVDGKSLCKRHMMGEACFREDCKHLHMELAERPPCVQVRHVVAAPALLRHA
jgi:hypothetical protein